MLDVVRAAASVDLSGEVELRCLPTRAAFVKELSRHRHAYRFPSDPADAYYLPEDRVVLMGTYVSPATWVIDFLCLHELFHHLYRHEFDDRRRVILRRHASASRPELVEAFRRSGRNMPWRVEERLCDVFAAKHAELIPGSYGLLGGLYQPIIAPVLPARR